MASVCGQWYGWGCGTVMIRKMERGRRDCDTAKRDVTLIALAACPATGRIR